MNKQSQAASLAGRVHILIGLIVALCYLIGVIAAREMMLADPDIWWHIKTGEWMWLHGTVPSSDPFSYTFAGQSWIAKEWLSQLLFYTAFAMAGWSGVAALGAVIVGGTAALLYGSLSAWLRPSLAASVALVCLLVTSSAIVVRPHLLTLPLLIVWTHYLFRASGAGRAPSFLLLAVILLWANLHAAFTMGFVIALLAFFDFVEVTRFSRKSELLKWMGFLALCPLVTLVHPYSYQAMLTTLLVFRSEPGAVAINEWQPFNAQIHAVHAAMLLGLVFAAVVSGFRMGVARTLLVVLLSYLFLTHVRYAFYLFPVMAIVTAPAMAGQFPRLSASDWRAQPLDPLEQRMGRAFAPLAVACAGIAALAVGLQAWALRTAPPEKVAASAAIAYVKSHGISGHVMNFYDFGGPLIFNDIPTFIDGRTDQLFTGEFAREVAAASKDEASLRRVLTKHDVSWTILPPGDPLLGLLDKLTGWKRVYADKHAVIHQRQDGTAP